jgi:ABC-type nitrate/sulfonate/bicarbonate transport system permease component
MDWSAAAIVASFLVSTAGFGFFLYGRKQLRTPQLVAGIALMVFPGFVTSAAVTWSVAAALLGLLWFACRMGW